MQPWQEKEQLQEMEHYYAIPFSYITYPEQELMPQEAYVYRDSLNEQYSSIYDLRWTRNPPKPHFRIPHSSNPIVPNLFHDYIGREEADNQTQFWQKQQPEGITIGCKSKERETVYVYNMEAMGMLLQENKEKRKNKKKENRVPYSFMVIQGIEGQAMKIRPLLCLFGSGLDLT